MAVDAADATTEKAGSAGYRIMRSVSTATIRVSGLPLVSTSSWVLTSSSESWSEDDSAAQGYREMGPTNLKLSKQFAPKVRKSWPEW